MTPVMGRTLAAAAGAAVTALVGGIAWAAIPSDGGTIEGCYTKVGGILRVIDTAKGQKCTPLELPLSWSQKGATGGTGAPGPAGADGASPTVAQLAVGDAACPNGGAAITDAGGSTAHVCSGTEASPSGTITSPNGEYALSVTDEGITLSHGSTTSVRVTADDVRVRAMNVELRADLSASVRGSFATVEGAATARVTSSGLMTVEGGQVQVKGGGDCLPAARVSDLVVVAGTGAFPITTGAPTVCVG